MPSSRVPGDPVRKESTYDRERARDGGRGDARSAGVKASSRVNNNTNDDDEDRIGPYLIGEEIGRGSFATVFKGARHVSFCSLSPPPHARPLPPPASQRVLDAIARVQRRRSERRADCIIWCG